MTLLESNLTEDDARLGYMCHHTSTKATGSTGGVHVNLGRLTARLPMESQADPPPEWPRSAEGENPFSPPAPAPERLSTGAANSRRTTPRPLISSLPMSPSPPRPVSTSSRRAHPQLESAAAETATPKSEIDVLNLDHGSGPGAGAEDRDMKGFFGADGSGQQPEDAEVAGVNGDAKGPPHPKTVQVSTDFSSRVTTPAEDTSEGRGEWPKETKEEVGGAALGVRPSLVQHSLATKRPPLLGLTRKKLGGSMRKSSMEKMIHEEVVDGSRNLKEKEQLSKEEKLYPVAVQQMRDERARKLGAAVRAHLTRREFVSAQRDGKIEFDTLALVAKLMAMPRARVSLCWMIFFFLWSIVFIFLLLTIPNPSWQYGTVGSVSEAIAGNEYASGETYWTVRTPTNFWDFVDGSILDSLTFNTATNSVFLAGNYYMISRGVITISQFRNTVVDCDTKYTRPSGIDIQYNGGVCQQSLDDGESTASYGMSPSTVTTTFDDVALAYATGQSADMASTFLNSTSGYCPVFDYNQMSFTSSAGAFAIRIYVQHPTTGELTMTVDDFKELTAILRRCNFIDMSTRRINVEILGISANSKFMPSTLFFQGTVDLAGQYSWEINSGSVDISTDSHTSGPRAVAVCVCTIVISVVAILNILLYMAGGVGHRLCRLGDIMKRIADVDSAYSLVMYSLTISTAIMYLIALDELENTVNTLSDDNALPASVGDHMQVTSDNLRKTRRAAGVAVFFAIARSIMFFRHRGKLSVLYRTLARSVVPLVHFLASYGILMFAFNIMALELFGADLQSYSSVTDAMYTLIRMTFGDFDVLEIRHRDEKLALLFFSAFMVVMTLVIANFFVAIVLDAYTEINGLKAVEPTQVSEFGTIAEYIVEALKDMCGGQKHRRLGCGQLAYMMQFDPAFLKRGLVREKVTLYHIRRVSKHRWTSDLHQVLREAMEDERYDWEDISRLDRPLYRYLSVDSLEEWMGPRVGRWAWRCPLSCRVAFLRTAYVTIDQIARRKERMLRKAFRQNMAESLKRPRNLSWIRGSLFSKSQQSSKELPQGARQVRGSVASMEELIVPERRTSNEEARIMERELPGSPLGADQQATDTGPKPGLWPRASNKVHPGGGQEAEDAV